MKSALLIFYVLLSGVLFSQNKKFLSLEIAGSGGFGSINFEHQFGTSNKVDFYGRYGLSYAPIDPNNGNAFVFPVMIHGVLGESYHKVDVGIGQTFTLTTRGNIFARLPIAAGYRFQPENKRYYLRASYTPIVSYIFNFQWEHWVGFTYGFQINKS